MLTDEEIRKRCLQWNFIFLNRNIFFSDVTIPARFTDWFQHKLPHLIEKIRRNEPLSPAEKIAFEAQDADLRKRPEMIRSETAELIASIDLLERDFDLHIPIIEVEHIKRLLPPDKLAPFRSDLYGELLADYREAYLEFLSERPPVPLGRNKLRSSISWALNRLIHAHTRILWYVQNNNGTPFLNDHCLVVTPIDISLQARDQMIAYLDPYFINLSGEIELPKLRQLPILSEFSERPHVLDDKGQLTILNQSEDEIRQRAEQDIIRHFISDYNRLDWLLVSKDNRVITQERTGKNDAQAEKELTEFSPDPNVQYLIASLGQQTGIPGLMNYLLLRSLNLSNGEYFQMSDKNVACQFQWVDDSTIHVHAFFDTQHLQQLTGLDIRTLDLSLRAEMGFNISLTPNKKPTEFTLDIDSFQFFIISKEHSAANTEQPYLKINSQILQSDPMSKETDYLNQYIERMALFLNPNLTNKALSQIKDSFGMKRIFINNKKYFSDPSIQKQDFDFINSLLQDAYNYSLPPITIASRILRYALQMSADLNDDDPEKARYKALKDIGLDLLKAHLKTDDAAFVERIANGLFVVSNADPVDPLREIFTKLREPLSFPTVAVPSEEEAEEDLSALLRQGLSGTPINVTRDRIPELLNKEEKRPEIKREEKDEKEVKDEAPPTIDFTSVGYELGLSFIEGTVSVGETIKPDPRLGEPALLEAGGLPKEAMLRRLPEHFTTRELQDKNEASLIKRAISFGRGAEIALRHLPIDDKTRVEAIALVQKRTCEFIAEIQSAAKKEQLKSSGALKSFAEKEFMSFLKGLNNDVADKCGISLEQADHHIKTGHELYNWERRDTKPIVTKMVYGDTITIQYEEPVQSDHRYLCADLDKVEAGTPPKWFSSLDPVKQQWLLKNKEKLRNNTLSCPSALTNDIPGLANASRSILCIYKDGELVSRSESPGSRTPAPIGVKSKEVRDALTLENIKQLFALAAPKKAAEEYWGTELADEIGYLWVDQNFLSPITNVVVRGVELFNYGDNNTQMIESLHEGFRRLNTSNDPNINDSKMTICTSNHPLNYLRVLSHDEDTNSDSAIKIFSHAAHACKQIAWKLENAGKQESANFFKEFYRILSAPRSEELIKDQIGLLHGALQQIKNDSASWGKIVFKKENDQADPVKINRLCMGLEALINYYELYTRPSAENGYNLQLFLSAYEALAAEGMGGSVTPKCKSKKDRAGVDQISKNAMREFYILYGKLPKYSDAPNSDERKNYVDIAARLFVAGQQQASASNNAWGSDGTQVKSGTPDAALLNQYNLLPYDIQQRINQIAPDLISCEHILAKLNKPESQKSMAQKAKSVAVGALATLGVIVLSPLLLLGALATPVYWGGKRLWLKFKTRSTLPELSKAVKKEIWTKEKARIVGLGGRKDQLLTKFQTMPVEQQRAVVDYLINERALPESGNENAVRQLISKLPTLAQADYESTLDVIRSAMREAKIIDEKIACIDRLNPAIQNALRDYPKRSPKEKHIIAIAAILKEIERLPYAQQDFDMLLALENNLQKLNQPFSQPDEIEKVGNELQILWEKINNQIVDELMERNPEELLRELKELEKEELLDEKFSVDDLDHDHLEQQLRELSHDDLFKLRDVFEHPVEAPEEIKIEFKEEVDTSLEARALIDQLHKDINYQLNLPRMKLQKDGIRAINEILSHMERQPPESQNVDRLKQLQNDLETVIRPPSMTYQLDERFVNELIQEGQSLRNAPVMKEQKRPPPDGEFSGEELEQIQTLLNDPKPGQKEKATSLTEEQEKEVRKLLGKEKEPTQTTHYEEMSKETRHPPTFFAHNPANTIDLHRPSVKQSLKEYCKNQSSKHYKWFFSPAKEKQNALVVLHENFSGKTLFRVEITHDSVFVRDIDKLPEKIRDMAYHAISEIYTTAVDAILKTTPTTSYLVETWSTTKSSMIAKEINTACTYALTTKAASLQKNLRTVTSEELKAIQSESVLARKP